MTGVENATAVFELFDSTIAEMTPELLGLWTTQPSQSKAADVACDLDSQFISDVCLWRSHFPVDFSKTDSLLRDCEARLEESQKALSTVPDRLARLLKLSNSKVGDDLAFDLSPTESPLTQPEQELLITLQELQGMEQTQSFDVDFSGSKELLGVWRQSLEQFQAFNKRVIHSLSTYALVETQIQGETVARTAVGWAGDFSSIWRDEVNAEQKVLHGRSLALALASRNALLQSFTMAVQLALKVSVSLSLPGGIILVLPAVWKFVNQVVNKFEKDEVYVRS